MKKICVSFIKNRIKYYGSEIILEAKASFDFIQNQFNKKHELYHNNVFNVIQVDRRRGCDSIYYDYYARM